MTDEFNDGSDLSALQELETEEIIVESGEKTFKFYMSSLVPADLVEARKRIARNQVDKDEQELFLAYMGLRKNHKGLRWANFRKINVRWEMKFIAVLYSMNGMDEAFRAINGTKPGATGGTGDTVDPIDPIDAAEPVCPDNEFDEI